MMQEADNTVVELDKVLISSMRDMIRAKAYELKQAHLDEDVVRAIDHIERVTRYTEKLEDLEKKVKNNTFNGYLSNAEIVIMKIVESVLKDIEKLQEKEGIYLSQMKLSIYESLNEIASIIEKYLD